MRLVLKRLPNNKLYVKPEKCEFHVPKTNFMGFVIAQWQLQPDPAKTEQWRSGPHRPPTGSCNASWDSPTFIGDLSVTSAMSPPPQSTHFPLHTFPLGSLCGGSLLETQVAFHACSRSPTPRLGSPVRVGGGCLRLRCVVVLSLRSDATHKLTFLSSSPLPSEIMM